MFVVLLGIHQKLSKHSNIMSEHNQNLESKFTEMVGSVKELTSEIRHLIKSHDETKEEVKELRVRVGELEKSQAGEQSLIKLMKETQDNNKRLAYGIIGTVLTTAVIAALTLGVK
jgi:predicted nuclease with TOPRIM domain